MSTVDPDLIVIDTKNLKNITRIIGVGMGMK